MTTGSRSSTPDRLAAIHAQLVTAVEQLVEGDAWRRMLEIAVRFPTYSANNVLLIALQRQDATRVCGLRMWNSLGRRVRKGEKGIAILAPCLYRKRDDAPERADTGQPGRQATRELRGFRVVHVFDVSQTEGEPLPDVSPEELRGAAPDALWDRLVALVRVDGFAVERGSCGGAYGVTDFRGRVVRVRDDVDPAQGVKTLSHEVGHVRADHEGRFLERYHDSFACRGVAEVEAESIAYLVTASARMMTDAYSVPYVASWSDGDTNLLRDTATRVLHVARGITTDLGLGSGRDLRPPSAEVTGMSPPILPVPETSSPGLNLHRGRGDGGHDSP